MDPFNAFNDPYGVPGDPMEEVLSLQTYENDSLEATVTIVCPTKTETCTISCPQKPSASFGGESVR